MPTSSPLSDARAEVVRQRVLDGVAEVLAAGEPLTFARLADAAGVPERTLYRHFPSRQALMHDVFAWANERIGFEGDLPTDRTQLVDMIRTVFPGFDEIGPVIRELMTAQEGREARLANKDQRQAAAMALVAAEQLDLDGTDLRRIAAITQLLAAASTWETLRDFWDMDGAEAAETVALAIDLIVEGARCRKNRSADNRHEEQR